jgi:hypothetical protein
MTPREMILFHVLKLKKFNTILEADEDGFRNVCALIPEAQFQEIETICGLLDISKRELLNLALTDFLQQIHQILRENNALEELQINSDLVQNSSSGE